MHRVSVITFVLFISSIFSHLIARDERVRLEIGLLPCMADRSVALSFVRKYD